MATLNDPIIIEEHRIAFEIPEVPFNTSGGAGDVYLGVHDTVGQVAVKRLRFSNETSNDEDAIRRFKREGMTWCNLQFDYLLPFLGIYYLHERICLVSPFAANGSLPSYLSLHPDTNRRLLLYQTALAIAYLHRLRIIHGDIKGENILVSEECTALLSDFGVTRPDETPTSLNQKGSGSIPWQSPEILDGKSKSFESDIYAFGMTISEVLSGNIPFSEYGLQSSIVTAIVIHDKKPEKLPAISDSGESHALSWTAAERCWKTNPRARPTAEEVVNLLDPGRAGTSPDGTGINVRAILAHGLGWVLGR